ncbi:ABC-type Fe3+-siderophore transport system, permease component [Thioflavicoccus mobilis 8321]|uniref:ABC-type Fe3+-siderophore transport system, permease component n=1 Tax=Thioflavicoccus mobilis 8321 TaxID=765912 RepID=L0GZY2_9GAMM|nr:iron chelate uptake ABC transporter family permease subunit [Thioflavicoccus mobilis]AGA91511.1 ABC-type Fe3+-siderophore transport system, permease component [Thioflavicoccus mobilis 8321]
MPPTDPRRSRLPAVLAALTLTLVATLVAGTLIGPARIGIGDLLSLLAGGAGEQTTWQQTILWQVRLPRVLTGALVGAALALSGAVLQGLFRNPLASPSVLGVSSGASLGAVIMIFFGLSASQVWALPLGAFAGALATLLVVYAIATHRGHTPLATLLLAGIAVGAFNVAMSSFVLAIALESWEVGRTIVYWTMGGLDGATWDHAKLIAPVLILGLALVMSYQRELDALLVGEVHAAAIGVDVARTRLLLLVATALLTGAAVAVAGGIGFIGLVVPHIVRLLVGPQHRALLPLSALAGAWILVFADLLLRGLLGEHAIPLGVVTAAMGAPFFLFLLLRQQRRGLDG